MAGRLQGKIALVTAAGQGIGRAIAETFITEGAIIIATDLDPGKLQILNAKKAVKLDVPSTAAAEELAKLIETEFGGLDVLANVAGYLHQGSVLACADCDWDFSFDLNVKPMHRTIKAFLPAMLKKGGSSIVNMSSGVSSVKALPNRYVYGATKAAVIGLIKVVAIDFITKGIRCNAILPGHHRVALTRGPRRHALEADRETRTGRVGRFHRPAADEAARHNVRSSGARSVLASDESRYITGQPHLVDGRLAL